MEAAVSSEASLIRAAASGNLGAFSELVREYRIRVLRTATGIVGSVEEAEDVAQEVFLKVWQGLSAYQVRGTFASWLYRITVNTSIDALRRRPEQVPFEDWHSASSDPLEETVLRRDSLRRVSKAIDTLPPNARVTLVLREYEQLSYKEIAEVLQIPLGTVMSRLNYARKLLRKRLSEEG